jgi:hypothetical protein
VMTGARCLDGTSFEERDLLLVFGRSPKGSVTDLGPRSLGS